MDGQLIKRRLEWYGLAWLVTFIVVLLIGVIGHYALKMDVVRLADTFIPIGLMVLGVATAGVVLMDFSGKSSAATKIAVFVLAVLLLLPLLWAPVAGIATAAWLDPDRSIEYSGAYKAFRAFVANKLLYPIASNWESSVTVIWQTFQIVASIVGFAASAIQVLTYVRRMSSGRPAF